jgi:hypothetical protein
VEDHFQPVVASFPEEMAEDLAKGRHLRVGSEQVLDAQGRPEVDQEALLKVQAVEPNPPEVEFR